MRLNKAQGLRQTARTSPTSQPTTSAASTSLKGADEALDAKLKETRDLVDNLGANSVASVNGVSPVAGDVTVGGADIDSAHTASDYTASAADLDATPRRDRHTPQ